MMNKQQWRHEYKYLCEFNQYAVLLARADNLLERDAHTDEDGVYRIRSLYLDGIHNQGYLENESGVDERVKYRIRIYNEDNSRIMLEKKSKKHGLNHKVSCEISEEMCRTFMGGEIPSIEREMPEKLKTLLAEMQCRALRPVVIVEYERRPFVEPNGNVRITFDRKISSSRDFESFLEPYVLARPILRQEACVMEVKWDSHLPDYIRTYMELDKLRWSTFSKYYLCRKYNCNGGIIL